MSHQLGLKVRLRSTHTGLRVVKETSILKPQPQTLHPELQAQDSRVRWEKKEETEESDKDAALKAQQVLVHSLKHFRAI